MGTGHHSEFDPKAFGAFAPLYETYAGGLEEVGRMFGVPTVLTPEFNPNAFSQNASAPLKAAARCQLEVVGLANRRTQALLQLPTRIASCRTPQDLANEQMAFWRTAAEQYAETSRKIFDTWTHASADSWSASKDRSQTERDYITFNGSPERAPVSGELEGPPTRQRRVA
jgi:hypothetical protein